MCAMLSAAAVTGFRLELERTLQQLRDEVRDRYQAEPPVQGNGSLVDARFQFLQVRACVAALHRIDEGCFGLCDQCGEDIELNRLRANPAELRCIRCGTDRRPFRRAG